MVTEQLTVWKRPVFSWRYVFAGVITAIAVSIIMAVLGVALGFTVIDPMSNDPFDGLGVAFGFWSILSVVLSLAAGGFVAGCYAGERGCEHGFMVWGTVLLVATIFSGLAVGAAVRTVGSAVQAVGSGAAQMVQGVGEGISGLASDAMESIHDNIDVDGAQLRGNIRSVLRDTGVETLQPEYLRGQVRAARRDLRAALRQLEIDSGNYDQIINGFLEKQKARLDNITQDIDRDTAVTTLMNNRNMTRMEAEEAVDNALMAYNQAKEDVTMALNEAQEQVEAAKVQVQQMADEARIKADEISKKTAASALAAALAMIIGAVLSAWLGHLGAGMATRRNRVTVATSSTTEV